jgi:PAS domain S-box-containing protein
LELLENPDCPLFVAYVQSDGYFKYVNQAFADALGYTKDEMYSIPWSDMMTIEERTRVKADYNKKFDQHSPFLDYDTITNVKMANQ